MSEESISYGEDKENLLYISKKINVQEFGLGEEELFRESQTTIDTEMSTVSVGSDIKVLERIGKAKSFSNPELMSKLKPFDIEWSFGLNASVGLCNLTDGRRRLLFYSCSNLAILYNYCTMEMRHLEGHQNVINCISTVKDGDWLVTVDGGKDGCVIVWDTSNMKPVYTLFDLYKQSGVLLLAISDSARYLVTIGEEDQQYRIDFWLWTLGLEKPNDVFHVQKESGVPLKICYNPNKEEHIMIVFQEKVYFLTWDADENKLVDIVEPQILSHTRVGELTGGTYVEKCHESYASSSKGCILVFRTTLYSKSFDDGEQNNIKIFINAVKVTPAPIGVLTTIEGLLVIGDSRGHIYFFDKTVRILYWMKGFNLGPITSISFAMQARACVIRRDKVWVENNTLNDDYRLLHCEFVDNEEEIQKLTMVNAPLDATLDNKSFVVRDFFVTTTDSNIYAIDFLNNICTPLFHVADANISAIDTHDEKPYLVIAYTNGRITLINFESKQTISSVVLPKTEEHDSFGDIITAIKYSVKSLHLACGRKNGELHILEPVVLKSKASFRSSKYEIVKIVFSYNNLQLAYYDTNKTTILFNYNPEKSCWECHGKVRAHYDFVNDIMFYPFDNFERSALLTIGSDRHLVEYNNLKTNLQNFQIAARERIEQTAVPMTFVYYPKKISDEQQIGYILVADDKHKLKHIHEISRIQRSVALGPAFGCFEESHIKKMMTLPRHNLRYMVFLCQRHLGLQILPADGNPYKYNGYLAHPVEVRDFVISHDGDYVFTFGVRDRTVLQWRVNTRSVDLLHILGGTELEPYYSLLEGGRNGWLCREIQDLFFYMQILQQENIDMPRRVSDSINLIELPDLVRTCGYYPSDFELETLMIDIRYRDFDELGIVRDDLTFIEFVKLFINHRPAYGYSMPHLEKMFSNITKMADYPQKGKIDTNEFIYLLQNIGEPCTYLHKNLTTLLRTDTINDDDFSFLPPEITTNLLLFEILGIDPERSRKELEQNQEQEDTDE